MRFHILSSPNTQTTAAYPLDGFAHRTIMFCRLLKALGHYVILYGIEENEAPCDEFVSCMTKAEYLAFIGAVPYQQVEFNGATQLFLTFNTRAAAHLRTIKQPNDVLCTIAGSAQHLVHEINPELRFLEYSIGYRGVTAPYRVYQSHAWRHVVHGYTGVDGGREFDAVIPPWFDEAEFPVRSPESYVLYCGRIVQAKGVKTACLAAQEAGVKLLLIGHGDPSIITYGEFLGDVPTVERNRLLAGARAVLMPTQYIEPFGNVAAEAQLCGTPVLSTDYGAFTESVEQGVSGYRCHTLGEFVEAIDYAQYLDRGEVRARAVRLYGLEAGQASYAAYFRRLDLIGKDGWMDLEPGLPAIQRRDYAVVA